MNPAAAVQAGLLVFPPNGGTFPGRGVEPLRFLVDSRGAGANLPLRAMIVEGLCAAAAKSPAFDVVGGVAKAGTIWAAWLAWMEAKPLATVILDGPRSSGLQRQVEGDVAGKRVLLVDNWIRSGVSIDKAADIVAKAGGDPVGVVAIARTGAPPIGLPLQAVWDVEELLAAAGGRVG